MIDFTNELGERAKQRIQEEYCLWLTTVDAQGVPQPRPVWFIWDGEAFLVYSQAKAKKLQHIAHNPNIALHFDGGPEGMDIQIFLATAEIMANPTPVHQNNAYLQKYGEGIRGMDATIEGFSQEYSVAICIHPKRLRA